MRDLMADLEKLRGGLVPDAVQEMMTRSGGFNVPNDFFKVQGRMPAPVPATPEEDTRRGRWPLVAGAAGVVVAVGLVVAIFAHSATSPASPSVVPVETAAPVAAPPGPSVDVAPSLPVAIAVEPLDAEVLRDGTNLGTSPIVVEVPAGKLVELDVKRPGYVSQRIVLDGKQQKLMVRLEREKPAASAGRPRPARPSTSAPQEAPKPKAKPSQVGGGEIVNPWAH
jgi:serine/threonine-protein kinase